MSLEHLWELQQLELNKDKEMSRVDRQALKALTGEKEAILAREEELNRDKQALAELKRKLRREEQNLGQLEIRKKELMEQLYSGTVSNPKELSHLEEQVANLDTQVNTLMEVFFELEEKATKMEKSTTVKHKKLVVDKEHYNEKARALKREWEAAKIRLEALDREIQVAEAKVAPHLLGKYRRLQQRLGTTAIVGVENGFCGGCGIHLPSLLYQQVKLGELVKCESCGRILWILSSLS